MLGHRIVTLQHCGLPTQLKAAQLSKRDTSSVAMGHSQVTKSEWLSIISQGQRSTLRSHRRSPRNRDRRQGCKVLNFTTTFSFGFFFCTRDQFSEYTELKTLFQYQLVIHKYACLFKWKKWHWKCKNCQSKCQSYCTYSTCNNNKNL